MATASGEQQKLTNRQLASECEQIADRFDQQAGMLDPADQQNLYRLVRWESALRQTAERLRSYTETCGGCSGCGFLAGHNGGPAWVEVAPPARLGMAKVVCPQCNGSGEVA